MLTIDQRIRQSRAKWRIIAARELREFQRGERPSFGDFNRRQERDLVAKAYEAGRRDALFETSKL